MPSPLPYRVLLAVTLSLVFSLATPAEAAEGFYVLKASDAEEQELPADHRPDHLENTWEAGVRVSVGEASCSGSVLTGDGHVLTTLHCVETCLQQTDMIKVLGLSAGASLHQLNRSKFDPAQGVACPQARLIRYGLDNAVIVAVGSGYAITDDDKIAELSPEDQSLIEQYDQDYAILKFDIEKLDRSSGERNPARAFTTQPIAEQDVTRIMQRNLPALRVSDAPPEAGRPIWSVQFPQRAQRLGGPPSLGRKYITYGEWGKTDLSQNEVFKTFDLSEALLGRLRSQYAAYRLTDLDATPRSSGSGVTDLSGRLVGTLTGVAIPSTILGKHYKGKYFSHTTIVLPMKTIRDSVKGQLGVERAAQILRDPDHE